MSIVSILSVVFGSLLIGVALMDLFRTVFMIGGGAGPLSRQVAESAWRLALRLHKPDSAESHSRLRAAGPFILIAALIAWMLELILGWTLIFVPEAFSDGTNASFMDRWLFAAQSIVGRSGNTPAMEVAEGGWESIHGIAGATGVFVVSVAIAYVLPVLGAVAHKRSIAAHVATIGANVQDMRVLAGDKGGSSFELHLISLIPSIALTAERHRAYPVLHYFHSRSLHAALAPAIARLSLLLMEDFPDGHKVDKTVSIPLSRAIHDLFDSLEHMGLRQFAESTSDDAENLPAIGIERADSQTISTPPATRWLKHYVAFDGWLWEDVAPGGDDASDVASIDSDRN